MLVERFSVVSTSFHLHLSECMEPQTVRVSLCQLIHIGISAVKLATAEAFGNLNFLSVTVHSIIKDLLAVVSWQSQNLKFFYLQSHTASFLPSFPLPPS